MRLLLDTHVALWAVAAPEKLPADISAALIDPRNQVWVSVISVAEIAIKFPLARRGAGAMPIGPEVALERFENAGFDVLDLSARHAAALATLPPIHGDPFDRLLVAQANEEPLRLVTHDSRVAAYNSAFLHF